MAAEVWMLDILWHGLLLARSAVENFWSSWSMEVLILISLFLYIALTILAEFRWHGAGSVLKFFVWFFYVVANYVGTSALGSLTASSASGNHQLVAFWGGFFLLHLGGPDSITSYSVEDNNLSWRDTVEALLRVVGAGYVVWTSISGSWTLVTAAWLMLVLGAWKYGEKIMALYGANLDNIRRSVEKEEEEREMERDESCPRCHRRVQKKLGRQRWPAGREYSEDEEPMLFAHSLFQNICVHAMVDSSGVKENPDDENEIASLLLDGARGWQEMSKMVEIQLSLMYDKLYTKAAVIHTCLGYSLRVCSPVFTAAACVLFQLSDESGDLGADVVITRVLLGATLLLETASLVRALGSSWAASALLRSDRRRWGWLRHAALCRKRWHRLHRAIRRIPEALGYGRRWSGSVGEFNLLRFCSTRDADDLWSLLAKFFGVDQEDWWTKFLHTQTREIPDPVKMLLFERIKVLLDEFKKTKESLLMEGDNPKSDEDVRNGLTELNKFRTQRGEATLEDLLTLTGDDLGWSLGDELQEGVLTWHIATHVFLFKSKKAGIKNDYTKAIETLSNYMMYLLAFRPDMLPGLSVRSLYKLTCHDLFRLSSDHRRRRCSSTRPSRSGGVWGIIIGMVKRFLLLGHGHPCYNSSSCRQSQGEEMLASILCGDYSTVDTPSAMDPDERHYRVSGSKETSDSIKSYISLGSELANRLLGIEDETTGLDMLQMIFNVWVEMLLFASYRCSRESHAKYLSSGGELTTVVWLTVEHAGLFPIDKDSKIRVAYMTRPHKRPSRPGTGINPEVEVVPPVESPHRESEGTAVGHSEVNINIHGWF